MKLSDVLARLETNSLLTEPERVKVISNLAKGKAQDVPTAKSWLYLHCEQVDYERYTMEERNYRK